MQSSPSDMGIEITVAGERVERSVQPSPDASTHVDKWELKCTVATPSTQDHLLHVRLPLRHQRAI
jgi:hypothetical protein